MEESIFCVGWDGDQMGGLLVVLLLFKRKPNCEKNDRLLHNGTQGLVGWYLSEWCGPLGRGCCPNYIASHTLWCSPFCYVDDNGP